MNTAIEQIKRIDANLARLDKIIDSGDYLASGISVKVTVGAGEDVDFEASYGMSTNTTEILKVLHNNLIRVREFWIVSLQREHREMAEFISALGLPSTAPNFGCTKFEPKES